ncbi:MAG: formate--phosphoribosylaminoimidazolecarboxamide ligase family protein [Candidatus Bipolaricaulota bacterium]
MPLAVDELKSVAESYKVEDPTDLTIGVLGSHSALEIGSGVRDEGMNTVVVCQKGREETYTKHYRNLFDHYLLLDDFQEMASPENQQKLRDLNTVFIPNRSFSCYVGYDRIENQLRIPMLGNRFLLRTEERDVEKNQYYLLDQADISRPRELSSPQEIESLCIVKLHEKERSVERAFFYASSFQEFQRRAQERIDKGIIAEDDLREATIEEVALGGLFNANYFWSPLDDEVDLLGFDRRIQSDLDGLLRLPAEEQLEAGVEHQNVEVGHYGATMRESQLEKIFRAGRKFIETCREEYPPGMVGLFALQGVLTKDLEFQVFDVSPRIPGCPCVEPTSPYMKYKYGKEVGPGRRVAMELKQAVRTGELSEVIT